MSKRRITHGRHCTCGACASEDWTDPKLGSCGMHGIFCPREYQPLGRPGMYEYDSEPQSVVTEQMIERAALWMDVAANGERRANQAGPNHPARDHWRRIARGALEAALGTAGEREELLELVRVAVQLWDEAHETDNAVALGAAFVGLRNALSTASMQAPAYSPMRDREPPAIYLLWCPKCGRVRWEVPPSHAEECDGNPMRVLYEPVRQHPLRGQRDGLPASGQNDVGGGK